MMTGAQYLASLQDGRAVFMDGDRIADVTTDEGLGQSARIVARGYDAMYRPGDDARNPAFTIPRTHDELRARCEMLTQHDVTLSLSAVAMALLTSSAQLTMADPAAGERIQHWFDDCSRRDVRFAELSPLVYRLLELLGDGTRRGRDCLRQLAAEAGTDDAEGFLAEGGAMLARMHGEGSLLGVRAA